MKKITIKTEKPYDVLIGRGFVKSGYDDGTISKAVMKCLKGKTEGKKCMVVTDSNVAPLYSSRIENRFEGMGFSVFRFVFDAGERSKNLTVYADLLKALAENGITRTDIIVALGGGVVGDLAGFAAATYLRGIDYIQIPTTLLAAVDSSVGGKTGINLEAGKNLAGAFHQPRLVLCDINYFESLPEREWKCGLGEVFKYYMLGVGGGCSDFLADILEYGKMTMSEIFFQSSSPEELVEACIRMKAHYVEDDEYDEGKRRYLNLGHTFGHAIEKCSGYSISHGEAVVTGIAYALRESYNHGLCDREMAEGLQAMIANLGYATVAPFEEERLWEVIRSDKKHDGDKLYLVLPKALGSMELLAVDA